MNSVKQGSDQPPSATYHSIRARMKGDRSLRASRRTARFRFSAAHMQPAGPGFTAITSKAPYRNAGTTGGYTSYTAPQPDQNEPRKKADNKLAVIAAIIGNVLVGIVKFVAAGISGSAAMLSEGIHSIVDSGNGALVLFGMNRSKQEPDPTHPFGYGKELYFWTMVVSLLIFALGGMVSIYKGVTTCIDVFVGTATPLGDPTLSYIVLAAAAIIEGTTLYVALKQFNRARGDVSPLKFIRDAKDPSLYTVVLEDSAAEAGLVAAFLGLFLGHLTGIQYFDGAASIIIGLLLCVVAVVLLRETKGLLIGEGMTHSELEEIQQIVESNPAVNFCGRILTMYMGPEYLMVAIDAGFKRYCSAQQVLQAVDEIEAAVHARFPEANCTFIEAESLRQTLIQREEFEAEEDEED